MEFKFIEILIDFMSNIINYRHFNAKKKEKIPYFMKNKEYIITFSFLYFFYQLVVTSIYSLF